jgi:ribonuclease-3
MSGMDLKPYQEFAKTQLGVEFKDINLLVTALTHRSYVNEHRKSVSTHNERLEFLGDAVLELITTRFLFDHYKQPEGVLTAWRAALVRTESIGAAGTALGYESLIRMSRGEKQGSERARAQILANAFEAVIGAIYLDQGYEAAEKFVAKHILNKLDDILKAQTWRDPKSHLQEMSQRIDNQTPKYKVINEDGPDHDKTFVIGVYVGNKLKGKGSGASKQIAQQEAARQALEKYKSEQSKRHHASPEKV